jgi:hypothetical protein
MLKIFFKNSRNTDKNYANCQIPINMSDSETFTPPRYAINIVFTTLSIVSTYLVTSCHKYSL